MIVIDASVLAAYILKEPGWRNLEKYLLMAHTIDLVVKEVANSIWKAYSRGLIDEKSATKKFSALLSLIKVNLVLWDQSEIIADAFEISMRNNLPIYDTLYIALAKKLNATLITLDRKQYNVAIKEGVNAMIPETEQTK